MLLAFSSQLRLYESPLRRPTRWPSGSANIAMVGPSGTSEGSITVLPPDPRSCSAPPPGRAPQRRR